MFTKKFALDTLERALKTFAQTLGASLTAVGVGTGSLQDIDWPTALSIATLATLLSVLTSIASSSVNNKNSASLVE